MESKSPRLSNIADEQDTQSESSENFNRAKLFVEDPDDPPIPPELLPPKPKTNGDSRAKSAWAKLSVKDIIQTSPAEDQAETYLQRLLKAKDAALGVDDHDDDDEVEKVDHVDHVLSGIPDTHLDEFAQASQRSLTSKSKKKKAGTGGQKLFDMANLLMKEKGGGYSAEDLGNQSDLVTDYENSPQAQDQVIPPTAGDQLFSNAANLFLRKNRNDKSKLSGPEDDSSEQPADKKTDELDMQKAMEEGNSRGSHRSVATKQNLDKKIEKDIRKDIKKRADRIKSHFRGDFHDFVDFAKDQKGLFWTRARNALLFVILPCTGIAFLCFYVLGNPPCGTTTECAQDAARVDRYYPNGTQIQLGYIDDPQLQAAVSWLLLFLGVRLVITFGLAFAIQIFLIDFCCLLTSISLRLCGSFITLFIVQSKGWPFISLAWGVLNFALLYGTSDFANHWGYWQDWLDIVSSFIFRAHFGSTRQSFFSPVAIHELIFQFNANNQAGEILTSRAYTGLLASMIVAGFSVAAKRYSLGLWFGRRAYTRYASELGKVMEKAVLIREVARLSENVAGVKSLSADNIQVKQCIEQGIEKTDASEEQSLASKGKEEAFTGAYLSGSTQHRINDLLGEFEEPEMFQEKEVHVAISDIIRFRQSVAFLKTTTPFSTAFGRADKRESCIANSQRIYERFIQHGDDEVLHFNTLAKLCVEDDEDELDEEKLRKLLKLFRPDRDGTLTKLDFVKSVDTVYKEIRLLRAGVANSQRVDRSSESIFQVFFYLVLSCICLAILGLDPFALFLGISGLIIGFAFMVRELVAFFSPRHGCLCFPNSYFSSRLRSGLPPARFLKASFWSLYASPTVSSLPVLLEVLTAYS